MLVHHRRATVPCILPQGTGHVGVAKALLESVRRFDAVNALDWNAGSALHIAADNGSAGVAKLLLESPRFTRALQQNEREQTTALHNAAYFGQLEVLQMLLTHDGFPKQAVNATNRWGGTALHTAAFAGHCGIVKILLESRRFDVVDNANNAGNLAFHTAAVQGHADVVQVFLATRSCLPSAQGPNPLHLSAMKGHAAVARTLLASHVFQDPVVNARTPNGATALHIAVQHRQLSVVHLLLQSPRFTVIGTHTIRERHTALHLATISGSTDIVQTLLESDRFGAEAVRSVDKCGRTALQIMAGKRDQQGMELLRQSGKL